MSSSTLEGSRPAPSPAVSSSEKLGRVRLSPGITRGAMRSFYAVALFSTCLMAFMNFIQPFLLTEMLGIPREQQGALSGTLGFVSEITIILVVGAAGVSSERIGRRLVYGVGFFIMAIAYAVYSYAANVTQLLLLRSFFAVGAACVSAMLATVVADYPVEDDRGKATGTMGIMNGLGILLALFVLSKLPSWFHRGGMPLVTAGRLTYFVAAVLCAVAGVIALVGLAPGSGGAHEHKSFLTLAREGLAAGRRPGVALAYGTAFVARGDLAVVGTFLPLWVTQYCVGQGMDSAQALKMSANITAISQSAAFFWAPVIGILADRWSRVGAMCFSLALATAGYGSLFFIKDPTGGAMMAAVSLMGIGQISTLIASQVLIAQESPAQIRGSVIGVYGMCGAIGILISVKLGGSLFDSWMKPGPFVLMAALNGAVLLWSLVMRASQRRAPREAAPEPVS
jgi:MFS family permease